MTLRSILAIDFGVVSAMMVTSSGATVLMAEGDNIAIPLTAAGVVATVSLIWFVARWAFKLGGERQELQATLKTLAERLDKMEHTCRENRGCKP